MRVLPIIAAVLAVAGLAPTGCGGETYPFRYKLALELEVDGAIKRAFNVVATTEYTVSFPQSAVRGSTTGESLYLDLGSGRRPLVALLTRRRGSAVETYGEDILEQVYGGKYSWHDGRNPGLEALIKNRGTKAITIKQLPELVTFADPADPKTVLAVDPNDLTATLGPGVKWHSMTIEITDEPVTTGLELKLPWIDKMASTMLDGLRPGQGHEQILAARLNISDFQSKGNL
jgi:hypothetical protein